MPAIYDWPDALRPARVDWGPPVVPQRATRSTFDGSLQVQTLGAPRWEFTIATGPMKRDEYPQWEGLLLLLRGRVNRVRTWDWRREQPLTRATGPLGSPVVRVAQPNGNTLQTQGWTPSVPYILLAGTKFSVNGELKALSVDLASDVDGRATLTFEPPLRAAVSVGTALVLVKPTAVFMLDTDRVAMPQEGGRFPGTSMSFVEDVGLS